jgi:hypothetical protein
VAVKDRATLNSDADANLANNESGRITPTHVRDLVKDLADSAFNVEDDSADDIPEGEANLFLTESEREKLAGVEPFNGSGVSTAEVVLNIGNLRTDDGNARINFHAEDAVSYSARVIRAAGANGNFTFQNQGTGSVLFSTLAAGSVGFVTNSVARVDFGAAGGVTVRTSGAMPTGGNRGDGTINAGAVYDDNVLLTCPVLQPEFLAEGRIDIAKWDDAVPNIDVPEREEEREVRPAKRGGAARTERVTIPGKTIIREHKVARLFQAMLDEGFDPRDPTNYLDRMERDHALPGMPTQDNWEHGALSLGEMASRKWLAMECLAVAFRGLKQQHDELAARVAALESPPTK